MLALRIHTQFLHTRCTCGSSTTTAVIFDNTCTPSFLRAHAALAVTATIYDSHVQQTHAASVGVSGPHPSPTPSRALSGICSGGVVCAAIDSQKQ
eukprot:gene2883-8158_t